MSPSQKNSFMTPDEIDEMGFGTVGENVLISRKSSFYSPETVFIGDNVRIDDFCLLNGNIHIGSHIHIGAYTLFMGQNGIILHDFSQISMRVSLISATDDFSGKHLVGPQVCNKYRHVSGGKIVLEKHSLIGACSIVLPRVKFSEGAALGYGSCALGLLKPWTIYLGNPAKPLKPREKNILLLEERFLNE